MIKSQLALNVAGQLLHLPRTAAGRLRMFLSGRKFVDIGYVKKFILMILVSKRRLSPPHGEEDEGVDLLR